MIKAADEVWSKVERRLSSKPRSEIKAKKRNK